ncbi:MAG: propionyl-CoA carboxylase [Ilumatobacteraceae bacterium]|nr:propionyl-CoA carboxylase [Ilumatobacteraceae bacterium]
MSWIEEVEEINRRRERANEMGGEERVARQHAAGRMTVRERIALLSDEGSFAEIGQLGGSIPAGGEGTFLPDPYVAGLTRIDGRDVAIGGEDFTVRGGSEGSIKPELVERLAGQHRIPLVLLHDGAGFNIATLLDSNRVVMPAGSRGRELIINLLATVPVVAGILGSVAGGPAGMAMLSHWSCMVKDSSELFSAGPPVVRRAIGMEITKHELGGSQVHTRISGCVDNEAEDEIDCLDQIRRYLSYMPSNVWEAPPYKVPTDSPDRKDEELLTIVPRNKKRAYDMKKLVRMVMDDRELFEIQPLWGASLITGLARLNGHPVGVIANDPNVRAGAMDHQAAEKQARFMEICDQFGLAIIYFVDVPGLMVGPQAEANGVIRKGMRALWMTNSITVPLLNVNVRRCYGFGGAVTSNGTRMTARFAWPSAEFGGIPIEGGVEASFKRIIESAPDPELKRQEIEGKLQRLISPFPAAEQLGVEDMIDPRETRPRLIRSLESAIAHLDHPRGIRNLPGIRP